MLFAYPTGPMGNVVSKGANEHAHQTIVPAALAAKSSAETLKKARSEVARKPCVVRSPVPQLRHDDHDVAQRLSYSSWRRHQTPVSLRPSGARSSH
jgi:hypothetical protein